MLVLNKYLLTFCRGFKRYHFPVTFEKVVFPPNGEYKLPKMPPEPTYAAEKGEKKFKTTKRMIEGRGVEEVHTELIHKQYGLVAIYGGFISSADFNFIEERVNKNLLKNQFAIWRVPAPWLPRTKKGQGVRLGGGKGPIHMYYTPVRANRIILEVGGFITEIEARSFLMYLSERFKFPVEFVSEEILAERRKEENRIISENTNKFNWEMSSTSTHCGVENWLPSISAAVASYSPERYIWRLFIAVHAAPRFIMAFAYRNLLLNSPMREYWTTHGWFPIVCTIGCLINLAENFFLLLLTSVSSTEDHSLHKLAFSGFAICAIVYMFVATTLYHYSGCRRASTVGEKSYQYKVFSCLLSVLSLLAALYFFYRHNTYCEPGVYTLFALSEFPTYSCIDCNKVFTSTSYTEHVKCISEDQKYGGKSYVAKENKGEVKQNRWIEQVERAINAVKDPSLKSLLQQIRGYNNIPRKEAKFINFLQNSTHIRNRDLCLQAWNCISNEAKKMMEEEAEKESQLAATVPAEDKAEGSKQRQNCNDSNNDASITTKKQSDNVSNNSNEKSTLSKKASDLPFFIVACILLPITKNFMLYDAKTAPKFKWRKAIKRVLKTTSDGKMPVKKLRKAVFAMREESYNGNSVEVDKEQMKQVFAQKLAVCGVTVKDKIAQLPVQ
uniref:39S ribosomal protein L16, mitochondrial n=1 Tax=Syphacia muris TaxID=451379 RepID=A0A158R4X6_9BILA